MIVAQTVVQDQGTKRSVKHMVFSKKKSILLDATAVPDKLMFAVDT